jgi:uncharacterized spore protein YtfJ
MHRLALAGALPAAGTDATESLLAEARKLFEAAGGGAAAAALEGAARA